MAMFLFQVADNNILEKFTEQFKKKLVDWLNVLQSAIQKYKKVNYSDINHES